MIFAIFFVEVKKGALILGVVVGDGHGDGGTDACKAVEHESDQSGRAG